MQPIGLIETVISCDTVYFFFLTDSVLEKDQRRNNGFVTENALKIISLQNLFRGLGRSSRFG